MMSYGVMLLLIILLSLGNAAYIFAGHRTWLVMMVLSSCQAVTITLFVVFYRNLEKKKNKVNRFAIPYNY